MILYFVHTRILFLIAYLSASWYLCNRQMSAQLKRRPFIKLSLRFPCDRIRRKYRIYYIKFLIMIKIYIPIHLNSSRTIIINYGTC